MKWIVTKLLAASLALPLSGQTFEVAAVRPSQPDTSHSVDTDGGLYRVHNLSLKRLIGIAYDIDPREVFGGPDWADSDGFDINARIPVQFAQKLPPMMQDLLTERFHLVIHREMRQISGYALVIAKNGPKMEHSAADQRGAETNGSNTNISAKNASMDYLAQHLSRRREIGAVVVDRTGLTELFNYELTWTPQDADPGSAGEHPSIFTALQEQLGLRLEPAKISVQAVVIDKAEKPDEN